MTRRMLFATARLIGTRPYFRGRDRLTATLLILAQRLGPPVVIEIDGFLLRLDLRDLACRGLWLDRKLEADGEVLRSVCRPGDVVFDVGAGFGDTALIAAREVGEAGHVVAIEPSGRWFALLEANAAMNFSTRIQPLRCACTHHDGRATLYVSDRSGEYSSLRANPITGRTRPEAVPARSLRSLASELGLTPDVVKLDIEGAEWEALKGLLSDGPAPRTLVVETNARNARRFGYKPSEMCTWLGEQGYRLNFASPTGPREYSSEIADADYQSDVVATRA